MKKNTLMDAAFAAWDMADEVLSNIDTFEKLLSNIKKRGEALKNLSGNLFKELKEEGMKDEQD